MVVSGRYLFIYLFLFVIKVVHVAHEKNLNRNKKETFKHMIRNNELNQLMKKGTITVN